MIIASSLLLLSLAPTVASSSDESLHAMQTTLVSLHRRRLPTKKISPMEIEDGRPIYKHKGRFSQACSDAYSWVGSNKCGIALASGLTAIDIWLVVDKVIPNMNNSILGVWIMVAVVVGAI